MDGCRPFTDTEEYASFSIDGTSHDCFYWDQLNRGEIWVSPSRKTVEWYVDDQCIRKFDYAQPILKANFVDFATATNCLVIVLEDVAHVYYLSTGDSTTVCFPFPISNAFWYSQGIVLERKIGSNVWNVSDPDVQHRFITLSDPMAPFGFLVFSSHQKPTEDVADLQMLLFPRDDNHNITVLYDKSQMKLHFYYTQVLNVLSKDKSITKNYHQSAGNFNRSNPIDTTKNLRKISILNRRATSANVTHDASEIPSLPSKPADSLTMMQGVPRRSISATLDRMSGSSTSPTLEFSSSPAQQHQHELLNQAISSKDVTLTRISSITLPQQVSKSTPVLKCLALRFENQEAVAIFNSSSHFAKIWLIDLLPEVINSLSFKVYGNSPQDLIRLSGLNVSGHVADIIAYCSDNLHGTIAIIHDSPHAVSLYNPFVDLNSSQIYMPDEFNSKKLYYISSDRMVLNRFGINSKTEITNVGSLLPYPTETSVKLCFEALKWTCSSKVFYAIVFLWQFSMNDEGLRKLSPHNNLEFFSLESVLTSLILPSNKQQYQELYKTDVFQFLNGMDLNCILPKMIMGLHLIREELALNVLSKRDVTGLGKFLYFATSKMNWPLTWREYYMCSETTSKYEPLTGVFAHPLDEPPSIMKSLYSVTENSFIPITPFISFSRLVEMHSNLDQLITPRSFKILRLYEMTRASDYTDDYLLEVLTKLEIRREEIETYPVGILVPLEMMLKRIEDKLSQVDLSLDLSVISRPDLKRCVASIKQIKNDLTAQTKHFQLYKAAPRLSQTNLKAAPKDIYTALSDVIKSTRFFTAEKGLMTDTQDLDDFDEGYSLKKNAGLIFSEDRRFNHILSLLIYYKAHRIQFYSVKTRYREILKQKKAVARIMSIRTCLSGIGLGAVAYATEKPLATQKWIRPQLNFTYLFPDGTKISMDSEELDKDTLLWGEFHGGVCSGLRISKKAEGINGSWIAFNKPRDLDAQYGGFLLGLGLNEHLKGLEEWHVYNYLSPKKTHVSIGLLLGMSASMKGTMDLKLTKVLSVHIVALLPPGSSDLNINLKVQTAGLIGIGLLYQMSQHRRMSDVLFSQVTSFIVINEEPVCDEGYRLAAGIALGLTNLGAGDTIANNNLTQKPDLDESSESPAINGTGPDEKITAGLLQIVTESHDIEQDWIPENSQASAVVALMLMFLKTRNMMVATTIKPNLKIMTINYRPEMFMYRELAYHMIVWNGVGRDLSFVLEGIDGHIEVNMNTDNLPIYYTIAGRVLAMGIRYASTGDLLIRNSLLTLLDRFLPFYQYPGDDRLDFRLSIIGIDVLVDVLLVSVSMVMCGTGDLDVLRRARYMHEVTSGKHSDLFRSCSTGKKSKNCQPRDSNGAEMASDDDDEDEEESERDVASEGTSEEINEETDEFLDPAAEVDEKKDNESHYSKFIATSMSLGFLFLGSGQYALKTSDLESTTYLIISVLPTYMSASPLQETKHFWSMAVEPRCLVLRDAITEKSINAVPVQISVGLNESLVETKQLIAPCLLPDVRNLKSLKVNSPAYYPLEITFDDDLEAADFFKNGTILYIQPRSPKYGNEHEIPKYQNENDIQGALKSRIDALDDSDDEAHKKNSRKETDRLIADLGINDKTMAEIRAMACETNTSERGVYGYNLDMLCSDVNSGDVIDYQLELWRKKHCS